MKIRKILLPTDFSDCAQVALNYAVFLANRHKATLNVHYVDEASYLLNPTGYYGESDLKMLSEHVRKKAEAQVEHQVEKAVPKEIPVERIFSIGKPYEEIINAAKRIKADMIVMGAHGSSGLNIFLGSNAERVARLSPCPVMTIRQKRNFEGFARIVFPVDFSQLCRAVFHEVIDFVRSYGSELHFLHIIRDRNKDNGLQDEFVNFLSSNDISGVIYKKSIHQAATESTGIIEYAAKNDADLIVLGSHGRTGLKRIINGSVAEEVVNISPIPVLTLRSFKS